MNVYTGIIDINGNEILLGMYLQNINCIWLTYQVRIRNNEFVIHTGFCFRKLTQGDASNNLVIVNKGDNKILGIGADLFNSKLID